MRPGIELAGKRVLVVGLARTGVATALFCAARGARVTATDQRGARRWASTAANCAVRLHRWNSARDRRREHFGRRI